MILDILNIFAPHGGQAQAPGDPSFRLYDARTGTQLARIAPAARTFDLSSLGLSEGPWVLHLTRVNQYGPDYKSEPAVLEVQADAAGNVRFRLRQVARLEAEPLAGGMIRLRWGMEGSNAQRRHPQTFEIADARDLGTVLATIAATSGSTQEHQIGPYAHGTALRLSIRGIDAPDATPWIAAPAVVADAEGPAPPMIITA